MRTYIRPITRCNSFLGVQSLAKQKLNFDLITKKIITLHNMIESITMTKNYEEKKEHNVSLLVIRLQVAGVATKQSP